MTKIKDKAKSTQVVYYIMPVESKDDPHAIIVIVNKEIIFKYEFFPACNKEPFFIMAYLTNDKKKVKDFALGYKKASAYEIIEYVKFSGPLDNKLIKNMLAGLNVIVPDFQKAIYEQFEKEIDKDVTDLKIPTPILPKTRKEKRILKEINALADKNRKNK